jgi:Fur family transcriptional regulator, ferric uptake regulator
MSVTDELKRVGLKATMARVKVLEIFHGSEQRHLTADDVYKRLAKQTSDVGLGTVYRVLAQLSDVGILVRSVFDAESGKAVYEIHGNRHHDHLICLGCGRVDEFVDDVIERQQRSVAEANGYSLAQHQLALYGYCADCRKARKRG